MYSDMSMRCIACSSSNMNSASARASSVLPTPVGPRKRNVPIGRLGSLSPARERALVGLLEQRGVLDLQLHDPPLGLVDLDGQRVDLDAQPRRGLIDEVD